jgi:nucleoid-associated protein EbfC
VARGGMPGGFDVNALMKQAQKMQSEMLQAQETLKDEIPEEADLLAEMVQAAVNEALRAAQALAESKMGGITGGLGLPGM